MSIIRDMVVALNHERNRADGLASLCQELLSASLWYEPGHPGSPCHRTGWMEDKWLSEKRAELASLRACWEAPHDK